MFPKDLEVTLVRCHFTENRRLLMRLSSESPHAVKIELISMATDHTSRYHVMTGFGASLSCAAKIIHDAGTFMLHVKFSAVGSYGDRSINLNSLPWVMICLSEDEPSRPWCG